jgi:tRNA G46 methylase TrmB
MASLLKEGGKLRIKSDNETLYEFTKEEALKTPLLLLEDEPDYAFDEATTR